MAKYLFVESNDSHQQDARDVIKDKFPDDRLVGSPNADAAITYALNNFGPFDFIIADKSGVELLAYMKMMSIPTPLVFFSDTSRRDIRAALDKAGFAEFPDDQICSRERQVMDEPDIAAVITWAHGRFLAPDPVTDLSAFRQKTEYQKG